MKSLKSHCHFFLHFALWSGSGQVYCIAAQTPEPRHLRLILTTLAVGVEFSVFCSFIRRSSIFTATPSEELSRNRGVYIIYTTDRASPRRRGCFGRFAKMIPILQRLDFALNEMESPFVDEQIGVVELLYYE